MRGEKEALYRYLLKVREKGAMERLQRFKPNPGFQERFLASRKRIRLVTAGNQSGKTHLGSVETAYYALGTHPYKKIRTPNVSFLVTAKPLKDGLEKDLLPKILQVSGSKDIKKIKNNSQGTPTQIIWRNGSTSHLMSAEQEDIVFEGTTIDFAWIDEPVRKAIFTGIWRGMLTTVGHIWMTCTPLDEPWIYEDIYLPGVSGQNQDIEVFEGSSDENLKIEEAQKQSFKNMLSKDQIDAR